MVATLTREEIKEIQALYPAHRNNPFFRYCYFNRKPHFFAIWINPKKSYTHRYFNTMCSFNPAFPPEQALRLLHMIGFNRWKLSRLDIAMDFATPYADCFLLPPPTNLQIRRYSSTIYYGAISSRCTVCQYDKSKQLKEVKGINSSPLTRIEFRFRHKLKPLNEIGIDDFRPMARYYFVADTKKMRGFRCVLRNLTNGRQNWRQLKRNDKQRIAAAVKEHAVNNLLEQFLYHIEGDIDEFMMDGLALPFELEPSENEGIYRADYTPSPAPTSSLAMIN